MKNSKKAEQYFAKLEDLVSSSELYMPNAYAYAGEGDQMLIWQDSHLLRRKPWARIPHRRYSLSSFLFDALWRIAFA
jgi:hypothetical protein